MTLYIAVPILTISLITLCTGYLYPLLATAYFDLRDPKVPTSLLHRDTKAPTSPSSPAPK